MEASASAEHDLRVTKSRYARGMSFTCTDQGTEGTCAFHSIAKIILHNVCEILVNLSMSEKEKDLYQTCLSTYPIETAEDIKPYTSEACSEKGFVKIMLFYYIYNFLKKNGIKTLDHPRISEMINSFPTRIAAVLPIDPDIFARYKEQMLSRMREQELIWKPITLGIVDMFLPDGMSANLHLKDIMDNALKPILSLGLYVFMMLDGHGVVLANYVDGKFAIKNSWGETVSYSKLSPTVTLNGDSYRLLLLTLMLPMTNRFSIDHPLPDYILPQHVKDLYTFITEYESHYPTIRIRGGKKITRKNRRSKKNKKYKSKKRFILPIIK